MLLEGGLMKEEMVQTYPDSHELRKDTWQWILRHPHTCANAHRGPHGSYAYAKQTYFTQPEHLARELQACHLPRLAA